MERATSGLGGMFLTHISDGNNISTIIKDKNSIDFSDPPLSSNVFKPSNIYEIVSKVIDGVKRDFAILSQSDLTHQSSGHRLSTDSDVELMSTLAFRQGHSQTRLYEST